MENNKQFDEWFYKGIHLDFEQFSHEDGCWTPYQVFEELPVSSQWGVYLEFFDEMRKKCPKLLDLEELYIHCKKQDSRSREEHQQQIIEDMFKSLNK